MRGTKVGGEGEGEEKGRTVGFQSAVRETGLGVGGTLAVESARRGSGSGTSRCRVLRDGRGECDGAGKSDGREEGEELHSGGKSERKVRWRREGG